MSKDKVRGYKRYSCPKKNGTAHGLEESWYESGQKEYEAFWVDGKAHGKFIFWREDGTIGQERYHLYNECVDKEEYLKYIAITKLAGL